MRNIIAVAALLPAVAGQAQTVDICDRTQQVRDAIMDKVNAGNCAAVDSEGLAGVKTLDLRSKRLTALRAEDFDGLTSLRTLDFSNLRTLRLYENRLTTLPAGVFDGLTSLHTLDLDGNQLAALSAGVFDGLSGPTSRRCSCACRRPTISTHPGSASAAAFQIHFASSPGTTRNFRRRTPTPQPFAAAERTPTARRPCPAPPRC